MRNMIEDWFSHYDLQPPFDFISNQDDLLAASKSVVALSESIRGFKISDECFESTALKGIVEILGILDGWIDEIPPIQQAARYGNPAFRQWQERLQQGQELMGRVLTQDLYASIPEIFPYFTDSFGNAMRIDYGTGHETNFAAWLFCLARLGVLTENDYQCRESRLNMVKSAKKDANDAKTEDNAENRERQRLRKLAFSRKIISQTRSNPSRPLRPTKSVLNSDGKDIVKKGQRKSKYLFAFPCLVAPVSGGKMGELVHLDTKNLVLYVDFPKGRLKFFGTIIYPKNKYLTLNFPRGSGNVVCQDSFDSLVVFSDVWWIGTKEENPEEVQLDFPKELNQEKHAEFFKCPSFSEELRAIEEKYFIDSELQDSKTNTQSAAVEDLDVDLDAAEWASVNNLSFPVDLRAIGEYLIDAELEDSNTNTQSAAVEQLYVDLDAAEWSSWDDLSIDHINGCSVNNLSLPQDLNAVGEYFIDAELQNDNIMEDLISNPPRHESAVFQCPIDSTTDPVIIEHPAIIEVVQLVSESAKVTKNNSSTSKSMWSAPLKMTATDGTEYNLLLLDTEGIDAYDQTGTYSTQIFSLAVLLSSMLSIIRWGGIDEAALDRLSLVTKMTNHIRVRASESQSTAAELGHYSPIFLWLLRDFYLELHEDGKIITPQDYLEIAWKPMEGRKKDVAAKNEIRESIRAMFPVRECFTLVRPVNEEHDLQRLDQISIEKVRPEFRAGLDALTKFILEKTKPKQVGSTVMTGPLFAWLVQSYLDALNAGAVPTIFTSWQCVEERKCRRAYDLSIQEYRNAFDKSKPPEEWALREAHDSALQKALVVFKNIALASTATRREYKSMLHDTFKKQFEEYKANAFKEADMKCSNGCEIISKKLRDACNMRGTTLDQVLEVLGHLVVKYENLATGPTKTERLASFLYQSLEGHIRDLTHRLANQNESEKTDLHLKVYSSESQIELLRQQLKFNQENQNDYLKKYEDAVSERSSLADEYASRLASIQGQYTSLEDRYNKESSAWEKKYDQLVANQKIEEEHLSDELASLRTRRSSTEARLSAARDQIESAKEEAAKSRRKHDLAIKEVQKTVENITALEERTIQQAQEREDSLRAEFSAIVAGKDDLI